MRCKGRYHSEQNYRALVALFGVTVPDLSPLAVEAQESVGVVRHVDLGGRTGVHVSLYVNNLPEGAELYAAPQSVAVPDECPTEIRDLIASHSDDLFDDADAQQIWNACRAAMLAAPVNPEFTTHLVGEVVAWHHPNHERNVDFRWLDFNVEPGTKLYAMICIS